jgi:hypothetical protein
MLIQNAGNEISDTYRDEILFIQLLLLLLSGTSSSTFFGLEFLDRLADDFHEVLLECLLLKDEAVLVPDEIRHLGVPAVLFHASLEQPKHKFVIWIFSKLQLAAIVHELTELLWVALAQLVYCDLELLLLNVVVLFVLRATGKTLPRQAAA